MKIVQSIADSLQSDKGRDTTLVFVLILLAVGSFALGRLSVQGDLHPTVTVLPPSSTATTQKGGVLNEEHTSLRQDQTSAIAVAAQGITTTGGGAYVASKSGSAYHLPWCPGAQRIKEENKIYFNSKEEAEKAGYHPAGNCKGL